MGHRKSLILFCRLANELLDDVCQTHCEKRYGERSFLMGSKTMREGGAPMPIPMWRRVLSLVLSAILVFQNLTCWMTPAWAEEMTSPGTVVAAGQVDAAEGAGQPAAADNQDAADAPAPSDDDASNGADNANASDAAGSAADAGSASGSTDVASSQQTPQASSDSAAPCKRRGL